MGGATPLEAAPPLTSKELSVNGASTLALLFRALADEQRIRILNLMVGSDVTVTFISKKLGVSQSRASYHVKQLLDAGLVHGDRWGNQIFYGLAGDALERLAEALRSRS